MLGRALYRHAGIQDQKPDGSRLLYPEGMKQMSSVPLVSFTHDSRPNRGPVDKITGPGNAEARRDTGASSAIRIRMPMTAVITS